MRAGTTTTLDQRYFDLLAEPDRENRSMKNYYSLFSISELPWASLKKEKLQ